MSPRTTGLLFFFLLFSQAYGLVVPKELGCIPNKYAIDNLDMDTAKDFKSELTPRACTTYCFQKGYLHAAMKKGNLCVCGDLRPNHRTVKNELCKTTCSGDASAKCGGPNTFSLYSTGIIEDSRMPEEVGCLSDDSMEVQYRLSLEKTNSPERCIAICQSLGFRHAALEKISKCYCGEAKPGAQQVTGCHLPCPNTTTLFCGGETKILVFKSGILENLPTPSPSAMLAGCYVNGEDGAYSEFREAMSDLTPEKCLSKCYSMNRLYTTLYQGSICQCRNRPLTQAVPDRMCEDPCAGDELKKCGSSLHVSAYFTGIMTDPLLGRSLGCLKVTPTWLESSRVVTHGAMNNPHNCIAKCISMGHLYAGLKEIHWCVCRDDLGMNLEWYEDERCNLPCPSLSYLNCGGNSGYVNIYRTGLDKIHGKKCTPSVTDFGDKKVCSQDQIFREDFNSSQLTQWEKVVQFSGDDGEFVVYNSDDRNLYVTDGKLVIRPNLLEESLVVNGSLTLNDCTGAIGTEECTRTALFYNIIPPVQSAQICTGRSFSFRYGVVTVRAKLPAGDWIVPQITLKPVRNAYGPGYRSGKIRLGVSRGNEELSSASSRSVHLGSTLAESILAVGSGNHNQESVRTKPVQFRSPDAPWNAEFHNFTVAWNPDWIIFGVDSEDNSKGVYTKRMGSLVHKLGFRPDEIEIWKKGEEIAPFDQEFQICLGLSVGGSVDFPDDLVSAGVPKPWENFEVKRMLKFWQAREDWYRSWSHGPKLEVDYVSVVSI